MTSRSLRLAAFSLLLFLNARAAFADELLPADRAIGEAVDHYVNLKLKEQNVNPAPQANDATLIRRLTLDLVGRIPTAMETKAFVDSTDSDKRAKLIERLLASSGFVRHQVTELDTLLMYGTRATVRDYLTRAVTENRPWDRIFRDLMLPEETDPTQKAAGEFLRTRVADLDRLTNDVSVTFFGVNISCAQCHDHPRVKDWKQDHFFGMKSFFARTFDNGGFLGERGHAVVKFRTTDGKDRQGKLMFLTGKEVEEVSLKEPSAEEQKKEREQFEEAKKNKQPPPKPTISARGQLVDMSLQAGQRDFFARSIVNRVWHRLFGQGLVMPLDQMHSENPPSHPELLDWLARDTIEHNYDLRHLIQGLVQSQAYSRGSRWEGTDSPPARLFAVAEVRPLTPTQLAASLRIAAVAPGAWPASDKPQDFEKRVEGLEASARGFASSIEQPRDNFQVGVGEALLFNNSDKVQKQFLIEDGDGLLTAMKKVPDEKERIDLAVRNVFCRPPTAAEVDVLGKFLQQRQDRPADACRQMVWALLTSTEFRFNH